MADDVANFTFDGAITDSDGDTLSVTGSIQADYTTNTYYGNYTASGGVSNFSGSLSGSDGYLTDGNLTITFNGKQPDYASITYSDPLDPSDIYVGGGSLSATCFVTGTRIRTMHGYRAVEDLQVGDVAITASGGARSIIWIGHSDVQCRGNYNMYPVRIAVGAFGLNKPERDLWLSPGHPVLVGADADNCGGWLVPIMCLINGITIDRQSVERVTYWHVELDAHDILLAEGLPAESYLDWGDRAFFTEGSDHALSNPDFVAPGLAGRCRPVALDGPIVEAERNRLLANFACRLDEACRWPSAHGFMERTE